MCVRARRWRGDEGIATVGKSEVAAAAAVLVMVVVVMVVVMMVVVMMRILSLH